MKAKRNGENEEENVMKQWRRNNIVINNEETIIEVMSYENIINIMAWKMKA